MILGQAERGTFLAWIGLAKPVPGQRSHVVAPWLDERLVHSDPRRRH